MSHSALEVVPGFDQLNFASNCTIYGQWLSALITPDPWEPNLSLGGSIALSLLYLSSALPNDWQLPSWAEEANITLVDLPTIAMEWWAMNFFSYLNETDQMFWPDPLFLNRTIWDVKEKCPAAFCKAVGYTGNADLTGIGVSPGTRPAQPRRSADPWPRPACRS